MSNPNHPAGTGVDPSEGSIDEGAEPQNPQTPADEGRDSSTLEVDPSEGPTESR